MRLHERSCIKPFYVLFFVFFLHFETSPVYLSCLAECCCFAAKLQKCFVGYNISPDFSFSGKLILHYFMMKVKVAQPQVLSQIESIMLYLYMHNRRISRDTFQLEQI